jgi:hypothetical protein
MPALVGVASIAESVLSDSLRNALARRAQVPRNALRKQAITGRARRSTARNPSLPIQTAQRHATQGGAQIAPELVQMQANLALDRLDVAASLRSSAHVHGTFATQGTWQMSCTAAAR